jgi:hypothetical protein
MGRPEMLPGGKKGELQEKNDFSSGGRGYIIDEMM